MMYLIAALVLFPIVARKWPRLWCRIGMHQWDAGSGYCVDCGAGEGLSPVINIHALDSKSIMEHRDDITAAVAKALQEGSAVHVVRDL